MGNVRGVQVATLLQQRKGAAEAAVELRGQGDQMHHRRQAHRQQPGGMSFSVKSSSV
jgi:hypothetical protein